MSWSIDYPEPGVAFSSTPGTIDHVTFSLFRPAPDTPARTAPGGKPHGEAAFA
jgi:hypothetical protein